MTFVPTATVPSRRPPDEDRVAVDLTDVAVRYRVPHEEINTFKEFAIRVVQRRMEYRDFWALAGVSLAIGRGEAHAIVGRNGAGKSTLLRLVARVLQPTRGRVRVIGRVAPLLEIGAGFHPELTGRENVVLNATLLGRSKREALARFDEIISFAEIEDFVDAPLRTYSSGMAARLGFAVATAWPADVLIVDELLSVGDESFSAKSAARIDEFRQAGASILFVSHNLPLVEATCDRASWLEHGRLQASGQTAEVLAAYRSAFA